LTNTGSDAATVIDQILEAGVKAHASDVHFCPEDLFVRIYFRLNGMLEEHLLLHINQWPMVLSRLKILATMNIAETRLPQTGRFSAYLAGRQIDFRASAHPTARGESFVLRLLDRLHTFFELEELGFLSHHVHHIKEHLKQPYGLIMMTGPTGSGKTTTLYSMLAYLNTTERNIMTLEDPIEYEMHNVRQTQVQPIIGFDFADGVRSLLRQDPDVILIGEIRDEATASMALRAAMTGHLVLTTLHTNSALSAVNRLIDLGINDALLSGQINCILSQRLVKNSTTSGRRPVVEVLTITPELDALLVKRTPYHNVLQHAQNEGFQTMQDQARTLIAQGDLALEDVQRVLVYHDLDAKG
jgi:type II secretory ATPase GspE/PulE/Tfp pilus assembly ATPase PilB-like protein